MDVGCFEDHFRRAFPDLVESEVLVALSGGADSIALLHLFHQSALGLSLSAAHVHHGIRGEEADQDEQFCQETCQSLGIPYSQIRLKETPPTGRGREAAWRAQRYAALKNAARTFQAKAIATAHHRDDVAEGVILQMLRGAGPRAMAGIHTRDRTVIRPMLPFSGREIREWLLREELPWREDSSNQNPEHLRNRIRHDVLPLLERIEPSVRSHLNRIAHALADSESFMAQDLEARNLWIDPWNPDGGVAVDSVALLPQALRVRWLHSQVARIGLPGATHRQGELLHDLLSGSTPALTLANRWVLRRAGGLLWLEPPLNIPPYRIDFELDSEIDLPIPGWRVFFRRKEPGDTPDHWTFPCSPGGNLFIRSPRSEDRLSDGRRLTTVLRTFLPRHLRRIWPILFDGDKLLWIPGVTAESTAVGGPRIVEVTRK